MPSYRISGHESFPCRYACLPKAVRNVGENPALFADEDDAMVRLGVGKNMVRAIRFWVDAVEVIQNPKKKSQDADVEVASAAQPLLLEKAKGQYGNRKLSSNGGGDWMVSDFGNAIFGPAGHDPFLEDIKTLWLIHWKLATSTPEPLFAWHYLLNSWHRPDFTRTEVLDTFTQEAARLGRKVSGVTLDQHFTTFLHTYVPTRSKKGEVLEDNLDCPLVELELIQKVGERPTGDSNRHEAIYAFRVEDKPDISPELSICCLEDFWDKRHTNEKTLTFREIAVGEGGPGMVFKLPEHDIRERLESIERDSDGRLLYQESAAFQQVARAGQSGPTDLLDRIYRKPADTARSPSTPPYQSGLQERAVAYGRKTARRRLRTR
jgi:hypothetical protein